jgi:hypothetical protein
MDKLFDFCARLDGLGMRYDVQIARPGAVMVTLVVPGEYLEIEFFVDGNVEVGRFRSQGVDSASDADLDAVIAALSS